MVEALDSRWIEYFQFEETEQATYPSGEKRILVAVANCSFPESKKRMKVSAAD